MREGTLDFSEARILIVGDVMLDRYWFGNTARVSPEAPVPVVLVNRVDERPGGAANVASGLLALGATAHLQGLVGQDDNALCLKKLLDSQALAHTLLDVPGHKTITKLRVLSRNQQMIRLDAEQPFSISQSQPLKAEFLKTLPTVNAIILSDYGKGTLADAKWFIEQAVKANIPIMVDPKSQDFSIYAGASIVTPNMKELEAVVGTCTTIEQLVEKSRALLERHNMGALVVTRSEKGISVIPRKGLATHIPAVAREVHDVTGAGDTVIAVLGAALGVGMDLVEAATLGNIAAGIAVSKLGAAAVSVDELKAALKIEDNLPMGVMEEERLLTAVHLAKAKGERLVFTNGCFDILHAGHVLYLEQAKQLGDRLIVAVNDDDSVRRLKGSTRPINTLPDRMSVLAGLKSVDWVVPFSEDTPDKIIRRLSPHVLVKGGDYHDIDALPGAHYVLSQGGKIRILGLKEGLSTTKTIETIIRDNVEVS